MSCLNCDSDPEWYVELEQRVRYVIHSGFEVQEESAVLCTECKEHVEAMGFGPRIRIAHTEEL